jgi:hypothetical protein
MRVGGLARRYCDDLIASSVIEPITRLSTLRAEIVKTCDLLSDTLYRDAGTLALSDARRKTLLAARRASFKKEPLAENDWLRFESALESESLEHFRAWHRLSREVEQCLIDGEALLAAEIASKRDYLKRVAAIPEFRAGLLLSSPAFDEALTAYAAEASDGQLGKKLRRTERSLLLYLARTCYKTTPFSTLSLVCCATFHADGEFSLFPNLDGMTPLQFTRPNLGIAARISDSLKRQINQLSNCRVSLKQGWTKSGDRIRYLRRSVIAVSRSGPLHSSVTEREFRIAESNLLCLVTTYCKDHPQARLGELRAYLARETLLNGQELDAFLQLLVDIDLLTMTGLRPSLFGPFWTDFVNGLENQVWDGETADVSAVRAIELMAASYPGAALDQRRAILRQIDSLANQVLRERTDGASVPQPLLYEDSTLAGKDLKLGGENWSFHLADLQSLQRILPLFDPQTVSALAMRESFVRTYGRGGICTDFLSFAELFAEIYYRPFQEAQREAAEGSARARTPNPFQLQAVDLLDDTREELWNEIEAARDAGQGRTLLIPDVLFDRLSARLPKAVLLSHSFFCQLACSSTERLLVVNQIHTGLGSMYSRFCHMFEKGDVVLADVLRTTIASLTPPNAVFAELQGSQENNLNLHPLLSNAELVCPGEASVAPPTQRIELLDLVIRHNPGTDELHLMWPNDGKRVIPLYLGFLHPMVLPELHRILLHFSPVSSLRRPVWCQPAVEGSDQISFSPRICYRSLVLQRAQWRIPLAAVPVRLPAQTDFERLAGLLAWLNHSKLPDHFFVSYSLRNSDSLDAGEIAQKPVFIDMKSAFGLFLFERILQEANGVMTVVELLPSRDHTWVTRDSEQYVSEFVFEINLRRPQ